MHQLLLHTWHLRHTEKHYKYTRRHRYFYHSNVGRNAMNKEY